MGLRDNRTMSSFAPLRGRDNNPGKRQTPQGLFGVINKTPAKGPFAIFRAPSGVKIIRVSLLVDAAVNSFNESFWTFQLVNMSNQNSALNAVKISTAANKIFANQPYDILADTGSTVNDTGSVITPSHPATVPSQILKAGDVLGLLVQKTGSPSQLSNLELFVEYEITGLTTTTSSSTTITTSTTSSTTSSTSTSTSISTSSSTSSSTTTLTTTTSTTISTSTTVTTSSSTSTSSTTTSSSTSTSSTTSTSISTSTTLT